MNLGKSRWKEGRKGEREGGKMGGMEGKRVERRTEGEDEGRKEWKYGQILHIIYVFLLLLNFLIQINN
jgi:hypothetical protein